MTRELEEKTGIIELPRGYMLYHNGIRRETQEFIHHLIEEDANTHLYGLYMSNWDRLKEQIEKDWPVAQYFVMESETAEIFGYEPIIQYSDFYTIVHPGDDRPPSYSVIPVFTRNQVPKTIKIKDNTINLENLLSNNVNVEVTSNQPNKKQVVTDREAA